jgi:hypothetical protein
MLTSNARCAVPSRGDDELRDVELKVREETGSPRSFAAEPVRIETPRIRLFGDED